MRRDLEDILLYSSFVYLFSSALSVFHGKDLYESLRDKESLTYTAVFALCYTGWKFGRANNRRLIKYLERKK